MPRSLPIVIALMLVAMTAGCGVAGPAGAVAKRGAAIAARTVEEEPGLIRALALQAHAALQKTDAAYKALGLNTAAGRKLTPKREPAVRDGLKPVIADLAATSADIAARLAPGDSSSKLATLHAAFEARAPQAGSAFPDDGSATAALYRVAQYKLKLTFLIEYALRRGVLPELPAPAPAPSEAPGTGGDDGGNEERGS